MELAAFIIDETTVSDLKVQMLQSTIKEKSLSIEAVTLLCLEICHLYSGFYEEKVKEAVAETYSSKELRAAFAAFDTPLQQKAQSLFEAFLF
jgi:hypothetical protein